MTKILAMKTSPSPSCKAYLMGAYPLELGSFIIVSPKLRHFGDEDVLVLDCDIDENFNRHIISVEKIGEWTEERFLNESGWKDFYNL